MSESTEISETRTPMSRSLTESSKGSAAKAVSAIVIIAALCGAYVSDAIDVPLLPDQSTNASAAQLEDEVVSDLVSDFVVTTTSTTATPTTLPPTTDSPATTLPPTTVAPTTTAPPITAAPVADPSVPSDDGAEVPRKEPEIVPTEPGDI